MPWRIPVYDNFVRKLLGIPEWDLPRVYRHVARGLFDAVRELEGADTGWLGDAEPRSLLHGLDKCLWWAGGGKAGKAVIVLKPERVLRDLGLKLS